METKDNDNIILKSNKRLDFMKNAMILVLLISISIVVIFESSTGFSNKVVTPMQLSSNDFTRTKGRQPIKPGCVNIYGSDFHQYPNTDVLVVCENTPLTSAIIDSEGFAPHDENHGITYIETVHITFPPFFL